MSRHRGAAPDGATVGGWGRRSARMPSCRPWVAPGTDGSARRSTVRELGSSSVLRTSRRTTRCARATPSAGRNGDRPWSTRHSQHISRSFGICSKASSTKVGASTTTASKNCTRTSSTEGIKRRERSWLTSWSGSQTIRTKRRSTRSSSKATRVWFRNAMPECPHARGCSTWRADSEEASDASCAPRRLLRAGRVEFPAGPISSGLDGHVPARGPGWVSTSTTGAWRLALRA
ncbi:hypothetical protein Cus16_2026 [Curtobacterium sp. ER1/6]|nr:hypothetical protein Cus16_2026 [Curtobacterium sp. ER1/6]